MEELRARWARRLRSERLRQGLTQEQLAAAAGISQVRLSAYELGVNIPGDANRIALARALGFKVSELFTYPDEDENGEGEAA